jgi:hypothetical protein
MPTRSRALEEIDVIWSLYRALHSVLDKAMCEGVVRIRGRGEQSFVLKPERNPRSQLDFPGIKLDQGGDVIVEREQETDGRWTTSSTCP